MTHNKGMIEALSFSHEKDNVAIVVVAHESDEHVLIRKRGDIFKVYAALRKHLLDNAHDDDGTTRIDYLHDNHAIECIKELDSQIDDEWLGFLD